MKQPVTSHTALTRRPSIAQTAIYTKPPFGMWLDDTTCTIEDTIVGLGLDIGTLSKVGNIP